MDATDIWSLFVAALPSLPGVARELSKAVEGGELEEKLDKEVRKVLPMTGESKAVRLELEKLREGSS